MNLHPALLQYILWFITYNGILGESETFNTTDEFNWLDPIGIDQIDIEALTEEELTILHERMEQHSERLQQKIEQLDKETKELREKMYGENSSTRPWAVSLKVRNSMLILEKELIEEYLKEETVTSCLLRRCMQILRCCKRTKLVKRAIALINSCSRPELRNIFRPGNDSITTSNMDTCFENQYMKTKASDFFQYYANFFCSKKSTE